MAAITQIAPGPRAWCAEHNDGVGAVTPEAAFWVQGSDVNATHSRSVVNNGGSGVWACVTCLTTMVSRGLTLGSVEAVSCAECGADTDQSDLRCSSCSGCNNCSSTNVVWCDECHECDHEDCHDACNTGTSCDWCGDNVVPYCEQHRQHAREAGYVINPSEQIECSTCGTELTSATEAFCAECPGDCGKCGKGLEKGEARCAGCAATSTGSPVVMDGGTAYIGDIEIQFQ
jgi:hypothetical protein